MFNPDPCLAECLILILEPQALISTVPSRHLRFSQLLIFRGKKKEDV
jgi:hypothetical protein